MNQSIVDANAHNIGVASQQFFVKNNLPLNFYLMDAFSHDVFIHLSKWHEDRGMAFNPQEILIGNDAIEYAMTEMQKTHDKAQAMALLISLFGMSSEMMA